MPRTTNPASTKRVTFEDGNQDAIAASPPAKRRFSNNFPAHGRNEPQPPALNSEVRTEAWSDHWVHNGRPFALSNAGGAEGHGLLRSADHQFRITTAFGRSVVFEPPLIV